MAEEITKDTSEGTVTSRKRKVFWGRFAAWTVFSCVLPVAFIAWRYDLFTKVGTLQLSGYGVVAVIILAAFAIAVCKYVKRAMDAKWTMAGQCISGTAKVIVPLFALFLVLKAMEQSIGIFIQCLGVVIVCETIAIPLNPMPRYVYEATEGRTQDTIDYFFRKVDERKEGK